VSGDGAKIVLLNASPRKYGSCAKLEAVAAKGVEDAGGVVYAKYYLYDYSIKPCIGCVSDDQRVCKYPCIIRDDDFNAIASKILESEGFIVVSPIYWYSVPGVLKNFIDRLTSMENMIHHTGRSLLEGKVAGFIVAGNDSGGIHTIAYLMVTLNSMGVHIPCWALAYSYEYEVLEDEQALMDAYNVGYIVARAAQLLRSVKEWYNPRVDLEALKKLASSYASKYSSEKALRSRLYNTLTNTG